MPHDPDLVLLILQTSVSLIVANLSVVIAFLCRIGTEETATFSPNELKSIITFGSQPIRQRAQHDPVCPAMIVGIETTTVTLDDFGKLRREDGNGEDAEVLPEMPDKPAPLAVA